MTADQLARIVVRLYPRAWRARYQDEIVALLEQRPATSRDVVDLAFGCLRQWGGAAGREFLGWIAAVLRLAASALIFTLPAWGLASMLRASRIESWAPWLVMFASLPSLPMFVRILYINRSWGTGQGGHGRFIRLAPIETRTWRIALFIGAVVHFSFRPIVWDGEGLAALVISFPGMCFWILDRYAAKPLFMRPPSADVPSNPLGLT